MNLRNRVPSLARLMGRCVNFSVRRSLAEWRRPWDQEGRAGPPDDVAGDGRDVVLFGDTFNRYFERENLEAAERVLEACGYRLHRVKPLDGRRPLCCGRTYLTAGLVHEARIEARRTVSALAPFVERGARVVGLEPSCIPTFRDEFGARFAKQEVDAVAGSSFLLEEMLAADSAAGTTRLPLADQKGRIAHLHGHCHQKAFAATGAVEAVLKVVPGLRVETMETSCCGMAGAFGYKASAASSTSCVIGRPVTSASLANRS